jgi:hypothetical protein
MQTAPLFLVAHELQPQPSSPRSTRGDIGEIIEECIGKTAESLVLSQAASQSDVTRAIDDVRKAQAENRPLDLLEAVARVQGHQEEHMGGIVRTLGDRLAAILNPSPPLIPFAGKLIAPSHFYESFDHIHKIARVLLSPVIYAEDTDAIGTASANPVAAMILAEEIRNSVFKRFGIRPFVTAARLDYESWTFLSRKHFEL